MNSLTFVRCAAFVIGLSFLMQWGLGAIDPLYSIPEAEWSFLMDSTVIFLLAALVYTVATLTEKVMQ